MFQNIHQSIELGDQLYLSRINHSSHAGCSENLFLGNLPVNQYGFVDYKKLYRDAREVLDLLGMDLSPKTIAKDPLCCSASDDWKLGGRFPEKRR